MISETVEIKTGLSEKKLNYDNFNKENAIYHLQQTK